ncbi:MAG: hypothetical protein ACOH2Q_13100 [Rhodococcus sp. (in: high G+C Gram-positive bacteria)]
MPLAVITGAACGLGAEITARLSGHGGGAPIHRVEYVIRLARAESPVHVDRRPIVL